MNKREIIAAVEAHAKKNYNKGWDFVVECYGADEIAAKIGHASSVKQAIKIMQEHVDLREALRSDCVGQSGEPSWKLVGIEVVPIVRSALPGDDQEAGDNGADNWGAEAVYMNDDGHEENYMARPRW